MSIDLHTLTEETRRIRLTPMNWAISCGIHLRPYQVEIARAVMDSVIHKRGRTFVIILPRQSGKNEVQGHLLCWLLYRAGPRGGKIVSVSPTFHPQAFTCMERVRKYLDLSAGTRDHWTSSGGFTFRYDQARLQFLSAAGTSSVVGATADILLNVDEAQDVSIQKFDKDFDPMTASTNATRAFWGTAWTSHTLLHRQMEIARREQGADGIRRLFIYTADEVRASLPAYGLKVDSVIAQMGRQHPLVKTQYFCEEIDAQAGMFNANRLALMQGDQPAQTEPLPGHAYAFCIDVAGMDESLLNLEGLGNPGRDCTTLSVVEVDLSALATLHAPIYRVVKRLSWQGANHLVVLGQVSALASIWNPQHVVIDATGVGEGLWALLDRALPGRVMPVKFSQQKKSELGYAFLGIIETGRFRDCARTDDVLLQYQNCQSEILPGPQHTLRWGVPDGQRGPGGMLLHDDYILADALTAELDSLDWTPFVPSGFVEADDPLKWMDGNF
jgi:hypothetical protein